MPLATRGGGTMPSLGRSAQPRGRVGEAARLVDWDGADRWRGAVRRCSMSGLRVVPVSLAALGFVRDHCCASCGLAAQRRAAAPRGMDTPSRTRLPLGTEHVGRTLWTIATHDAAPLGRRVAPPIWTPCGAMVCRGSSGLSDRPPNAAAKKGEWIHLKGGAKHRILWSFSCILGDGSRDWKPSGLSIGITKRER